MKTVVCPATQKAYSYMKKGESTHMHVQLFPLLFVVLALVMPLSLGAQTPVPVSTSTEVAVATSTTSATPPTSDDSWFTSDWVTGPGVDSGDFVVGPGRFEITIQPGQTVVRELLVTNRISENRTFELVVEDVAGGSDGASVQLLGNERGPYTLKDYISFPSSRFTLGLGERAKIPVTISIPPDAEPGGRYGSVLVTTIRDDGDKNADEAPATRSPIIARIGSLFFITVPGDIERAGETTGLSLIENHWWYEKGPINLAITYENTGSIHLAPYGELRVNNMFGEEVGFSQLDPWFVLPKSLRTREITWDREFLLGRYKATVFINRGYDDVVDTHTVTFWVLPWKIVGGTFLVIFIIFFSIRTFFRTFEFKRKSD